MIAAIRKHGLRESARIAFSVLATPRVRKRYRFVECVANRSGLEIGGPSWPFHDFGILPLYKYVNRLDNCNFSANSSELYIFHRRKAPGRFLKREATELLGIPNGTYDFILASHALEHIANPIKALQEWQRVGKPGAAFVIVLPHYAHMFDRYRQPTSIDHMIADYRQGMDERDLSHLPEMLRLHDLSWDHGADTSETLRRRLVDNYATRSIHHHVFNEENTRQLLEASGLRVEVVEFAKPYHIVTLSRSADAAGIKPPDLF